VRVDQIYVEVPSVSDQRPNSSPETFSLQAWKAEVLDRDSRQCVNCGGEDKVAACFVVPVEVGGNLRVSNGVTVCRECRIAAESSRVLPQRIDNKTPINFLISSSLHKVINQYVHNGSKFGSVSALMRSMISSYITQPELYEDLQSWQDDGSDVKVNGWVDGLQYQTFKGMCKSKGISYTDALKGLLLVAIDGYEPADNH
jgi:5-methylcytosine-specific restriction endonuclease McrA